MAITIPQETPPRIGGREVILCSRTSAPASFVVYTLQDERKLVRQHVSSLGPELQPYLTEFQVVADSNQTELRSMRLPSASRKRLSGSVTVISSSRAGGASSSDVYFDLLGPLLKDFAIDHVYVETFDKNTIAQHASSFSASATVIIIGGDTSVHEFVNSLPVTASPLFLHLSVIPCGTGNALVTSMGLRRPCDAVRSLFLAEPVPLATFPVIFPSGSKALGGMDLDGLGCNAIVCASYGFHSSLVADADTPEMRKYPDRFERSAQLLANGKPQEYRASLQLSGVESCECSTGHELDFGKSHSYLLVSSVSHLAPNFPIAPNNQPPPSKDRHIIYMPVMSGNELMAIMRKVSNGSNHLKNPRVTCQRLSPEVECEVFVSDDNDQDMLRWCIDGRIIQCAPGTVKLGKAGYQCRGWSLTVYR